MVAAEIREHRENQKGFAAVCARVQREEEKRECTVCLCASPKDPSKGSHPSSLVKPFVAACGSHFWG